MFSKQHIQYGTNLAKRNMSEIGGIGFSRDRFSKQHIQYGTNLAKINMSEIGVYGSHGIGLV
jgi:hypothetical protein